MKVCQRGLESAWIVGAEGEVCVCSWTGYTLGNLQEHTMEELWNSEKAELFRQSMLDGSYCFCDSQKCYYMANNTLKDYMVDYEALKYPKLISLSYEEQCNYTCGCCRKEPYRPRKDEKMKIEKIENEINKLVDHLNHISANGAGELFCSGSAMKFLSNINTDRPIKITLESNGSLFTPQNWEKISNLGKYDLGVYITVHSFCEETYRFLSGTDMPVSTVIENLHFIQKLRDQGIVNFFEIATVVCERNFREMPGFVDRCLKEFNPDSIRMRSFLPYGVDSRAIEWFYDIRNPYHPYYKEYVEVMKNPVFNNSKVWKWQGDQVSAIGEHPYFTEHRKLELEHKKLELIERILGIVDLKVKLEKFLCAHNIKSFSLYGFSNACKCFVMRLDDAEIKVDKIFDSNVNCDFEGKNVIQPKKDNLTSEAIIIMSLASGEIRNKLQDLGYKGEILDVESVLDELKRYDEEGHKNG